MVIIHMIEHYIEKDKLKMALDVCEYAKKLCDMYNLSEEHKIFKNKQKSIEFIIQDAKYSSKTESIKIDTVSTFTQPFFRDKKIAIILGVCVKV